MNDKDLSSLKALAEAATPGPWRGAAKPYIVNATGEGAQFSAGDWSITPPRGNVGPVAIASSQEDSDFIAAANPQAILSLISRIEQLECEREHWRKAAAVAAGARAASSPSPAVDLSGLTRYDPDHLGAAVLIERPYGDYVKLTDVQALLVTQGNADAVKAVAVSAQDAQKAIHDAAARLVDGEETPEFRKLLLDMHEATGLSFNTLRSFKSNLASPASDVGGLTDSQREAVREAIAGALGEAYDCTRVWSAWSYGTMGPDDFSLVAEDDGRLDEITEAVCEVLATKEAEPGLEFDADFESLKEQSEAWFSVCDVLHEVRPGWNQSGLCDMDSAVATIRALATSPAPSVKQGLTYVGTLSVYADKEATFGHAYDISTNAAGHKALQAMDGYELFAAAPSVMDGEGK